MIFKFRKIIEALSLLVWTIESTNIRILPLGDSLTSGTGYPGGYRTSLYHGLQTEGYDVDFIGGSQTNSNEYLPDIDHEGHYGESNLCFVRLNKLIEVSHFHFIY